MNKLDFALQVLLIACVSAGMVAFRYRPIPYDGSIAPYVSHERLPGLGDFVTTAAACEVLLPQNASPFVGYVVIWIARSLMSCVVAGIAFWTVKSKRLNYGLVLSAALAINIVMGLGEFYID